MKSRISKFGVAVLIGTIGLASTVQAQMTPNSSYSLGGNSGGVGAGTTNSYAVISAVSVRGGAPVVTYVDATSDLAGSVIQSYRVAYIMPVNLTNSSTNLYVTVPKGADKAGVVLVRHLATDTYERLYCTTNGLTGTNVATTVAPAEEVIPNDYVYFMSAAGKIPCGATNVWRSGPGIFAGQRDLPLLIEINGTSACSLNALTAGYTQ